MVASSQRRAPDAPDDNSGPKLTPISLLLVLVIFALLLNLGSVIVSVLMAILLGTILEWPVQQLQKRGLPRAAAIALCYVGVIAAVAALVVVIIPVVADQWDTFRATFPDQMRELRDDWSGSSSTLLNRTGVDLLDRGISLIEGDDSAAPTVSGDTAAAAIPIVSSVVGAIASLVTTLVITFYYLLEKKLVRSVIIDQISSGMRERVDSLWTEVESKVGGWLRGQLILCAIIGTVATVSYAVIGVNFWPLLGLWAGVTEILPIVGPWIGGIPAVLVALTMGLETAVLVTVVIIGMQALENWFLVPRVMRGAVGLTPLTVFVAILSGTQLMGFVGAVLAIPVAAGLQVVITDIFSRRRQRDDGDSAYPAGGGWRWMLNRALDRDGVDGQHAHADDGSQVESDVTYAANPEAETTAPARPAESDDVTFEEAPRILTEEDLASDSPARAAEATWPTSSWQAGGAVSRDASPWKAARKQSNTRKDND